MARHLRKGSSIVFRPFRQKEQHVLMAAKHHSMHILIWHPSRGASGPGWLSPSRGVPSSAARVAQRSHSTCFLTISFDLYVSTTHTAPSTALQRSRVSLVTWCDPSSANTRAGARPGEPCAAASRACLLGSMSRIQKHDSWGNRPNSITLQWRNRCGDASRVGRAVG